MDDRPESMGAVRDFMTRAQAAMDAAEAARSDDAVEALYKEAETWIYMAGRILDPGVGEPPKPLPSPARRAAAEDRSFRRTD